jgi:probable HAF family extracellular repeat protein
MRLLVTITLALATAVPAAAQPVTYTVMDLGPGTISAINASGQTTGIYGSGLSQQLFRASPTGQVALLGTSFSYVGGINDYGQIAGAQYQATSNSYYAFLTTPTGDLSTAKNLGGTVLNVHGVNNNGQVVGVTSSQDVFRTAPGGMVDSSADLGPGFGMAINATGQVTGYSGPGGTDYSFRTTATGGVGTADNLGSLGGRIYSFAINAPGQVAGYSFLAPSGFIYHAFRSSGNGQSISLQDLGSLTGSSGSSRANGINTLGVVVGYSASAAGAIGTAGQAGFVFTDQMYNLNTLVPAGWHITSANAINDSGWIAAQGSFNGGSAEALVLVPVAVPEPSTLVLTALAVVGLATKRLSNRRRRQDAAAKT